jgi:hypothetical protein
MSTPMKINHAGAHLDHLLRQTRMHHVQLSSMADAKANALMTMSAVMMTLSTPYLGNEHFKLMAVVLMSFCLLTILLATYTVLPKITISRSPAAAPSARPPFFNLLFFGDFVGLDLEQFKAEMEEVMNDPSRTYEAQVQEIYALGKYLAERKYRVLRLAYLSFVTGLLVSGTILLVTSVFRG